MWKLKQKLLLKNFLKTNLASLLQRNSTRTQPEGHCLLEPEKYRQISLHFFSFKIAHFGIL